MRDVFGHSRCVTAEAKPAAKDASVNTKMLSAPIPKTKKKLTQLISENLDKHT